jgi:hypothetical protein
VKSSSSIKHHSLGLNGFYLFTSLLFFSYVLIRAFTVGITFDEGWSIGTWAKGPYQHIFNFTPCDTNNHLLNSLLIKLLYEYLPETLFVARLSSLISFAVYLFFCRKLCIQLPGRLLGPSCFLLLCCNPFMLDFFSLARGYALCFAFNSAALYQYWNFMQDQKKSRVLYSLLLSAMAVLSLLTSIYLYCSLALLFFIATAFKEKEHRNIIFVYLVLPTLLLTGILWEPVRKLTSFDSMYYGGKDSFFNDTLVTFTRYSMYSMFNTASTYLICWVVLVFTTVIFLLSIRTLKNWRQNPFTLLFITVLLLTLIHTWFFNGFYLVDRTILFLYPVFILALSFSIVNLQKAFTYSLLVGALLCVINFSFAANFYKTVTWPFDSHTREIINMINEEAKKENKTVKLSYSWPFMKSVEYYLAHGSYQQVEAGWEPDYFLYYADTLDRIDYYPKKEMVWNLPKDTALIYPSEHVILFKIRH